MDIQNIEKLIDRKKEINENLKLAENVLTNLMPNSNTNVSNYKECLDLLDNFCLLCKDCLVVINLTFSTFNIYLGLKKLVDSELNNDEILTVQNNLIQYGFSDFRPEIYPTEILNIEKYLAILEKTLIEKINTVESSFKLLDIK